ncbi:MULTISPECIES: methyl-accepting chemotaxis protein [Brevibacillus]|uniref:methyl-accepting chemotaxis protein n=1 Tax=Brevibacillus TaxID=55080 RepID=UPI000D10163A|nr:MULTISPECIES: methyl-accepting chemotaxis protein [Brevibacillus]PSJ68601.1 methyl-accepting chemotaxis protein [Brevibacillus brevis]RED34098.1 methyl-accepting chemotaxis protein [Brevibacillus brevis]TQK62822.1 methyl-accepting chemotaxis protein [Brevibacillus sp. AG162]VEF92332.1 H3 [Brevibacillus brevis]GEC92089.1 methyl-accepting chemotaxis protein [Brevibacillus brevis]
MKNSLKNKLIIILCLLLLVSLGMVCGASYWSASKLLADSLDKEAELAASNLSIRIDSFFQEKIGVVKTIGGLISADNNFDHDLKLIQEAQKENPEFETFFFSYDLSGTKVINFKGEVTNPSDRPHFQEAGKGEGKVIVSEPVVSKRTGNNIVTIIVPLMKDNRQYGYVGSTIPINEIQQKVSQEKFGQSGYAFLVSKTGTFIYHPTSEYILKESILNLGFLELQTAFEDIKNGTHGVTQYQYEQIPQFVSYAPTSLNWGVYITAPIAELHAPVDALSLQLMIISLIVLAVGVVLVYFLAVRMVKPIERLNQAVNIVAQGNLAETVTVEGKDEIAVLSRDFNQTVSHLKNLIEDVSLSSDQVQRFSQEVSEGIKQATENINQIGLSIGQISEGVEAQAASSQEVALSMTDMAAGIVKIAETSAHVSEAAQIATEQAEQGTAVVEQAVRQMGSIGEGTSKATVAIEQLNNRSKEIEGILDTISQLTSQINLLALNASIEAARAGEHGRGFAVVAGEVKKLANQSEESASKIAMLIGEIQQDTRHAVEVMTEGNENAQQGIQLVEEVREIFGYILESSRNVAAHILEVSAASEQMSAGSEQVSASVDEMHNIAKHASLDAQTVARATEEQLQAIQEIGQSVERLNAVAEELQQGIGRFTV